MTYQEAEKLKNDSEYVIGQELTDYKKRGVECNIFKLLIAPKGNIKPILDQIEDDLELSNKEMIEKTVGIGGDFEVYVLASDGSTIYYVTLHEQLNQ